MALKRLSMHAIECYGCITQLDMLETLVARPVHKGTCYMAANWVLVDDGGGGDSATGEL